MENDKHEIIEVPGGYQVVLVGDEYYRDRPGNILKRRVIKRRYSTHKTPLDAQVTANKWNLEDGLV